MLSLYVHCSLCLSFANFTKSIYTLLTTGKGRLDAVYPALLAILNNIAAYVQNIGRATSSKLLQLFASMSSPSFLFANENNHTLLQSLLEVLNAMIEHQYSRKIESKAELCITDAPKRQPKPHLCNCAVS
jgi:hypothetical protein